MSGHDEAGNDWIDIASRWLMVGRFEAFRDGTTRMYDPPNDVFEVPTRRWPESIAMFDVHVMVMEPEYGTQVHVSVYNTPRIKGSDDE